MAGASPGSSDRFELLAAIAPVGIFRTDPEGRCLYVNRRWCEMTGLAPDAAADEGWARAVHPDDRERVLEEWQQAARNGHPLRTEFRFRRPDGLVIWVVGQAASERAEDGTVTGHVGTITDITDRHRAEEALQAGEEMYRSLFEHCPVSLWEEDFSEVRRYIDGLRGRGVSDLRAHFAVDRAALRHCAALVRVTRVNRAGLALAGARDIGELLHGVGRLFTDDTLDFFAEEILALAEGRTRFEGETVGLTLGGERLELAIKFSVLPGYEESWSKVLISVLDQTERQHADRAVRAAKERAEAASRAKSEFLANMSHELRTPLNAIIGFAELMRTGILGAADHERYRTYATDIHTSGLHLLSIINDVLDVARIEAREARLEEEPLRLEEAVASVVQIMAEQAKRADLALVRDIAPGLPTVLADARAVRQMLLNILSNAIKFTPRGGTITIGVRCDLLDEIQLWVRDTGVGIAPADIPRLMQPFAQLDNAYQRKHRGTGLGLVLVRSLAELHGGDVSIDSRLGEGTTVVIRLPASRAIRLPRDRALGTAS